MRSFTLTLIEGAHPTQNALIFGRMTQFMPSTFWRPKPSARQRSCGEGEKRLATMKRSSAGAWQPHGLVKKGRGYRRPTQRRYPARMIAGLKDQQGQPGTYIQTDRVGTGPRK